MKYLSRLILVCGAAMIPFAPAGGDAIIRTQAMSASTIAQYFVDDTGVRLDLEIGLSDLGAFQNLLPDTIYESLGYGSEPLAGRLVSFFGEDLVVIDGDGRPLAGRITEIGPRDRILRDEISGEPLPDTGEEKEKTIFARLEYRWPERPDALTIGGRVPGKASVGFVLYHKTVPVNDFRYLGPSQKVMLDWEDPWYTQFERRALRRAYFAPINAFIYVEPYEVRKEIIARPKDLQSWIDLGLEGRETIPVEIQDDLKRKVAEFLRRHAPVLIDGQAITPDLAQINFLERTLTSSRVIDPPVDLDLNAAVLGVIFVYPTDGLPERVTMEWDLFNDRVRIIPAASVDQAGPLPTYIEPDFAILEWQNFLKNPELPTLRVLATPPAAHVRRLAALRWPSLFATTLVGLWLVRRRHQSRGGLVRITAALVVLVAVTTATFLVSGRVRLTDERAGDVVAGLLHNIYRAFDYRGEEQIYDVLANSVEGDLLAQIYLETRRGLELANQGGARAKVKEIDLVELAAEPGDGAGFIATATWNVTGSVGHWGHVHRRSNQYRAELDIRPLDGEWKLVEMEILEAKRL